METSYARAVGGAALQGLFTVTWFAAAEMPAAQRRLARLGTVAAGSALIAIGARSDDDEQRVAKARAEGLPADAVRKLAVAVVLSAGVAVGRRQLEKRWLAALVRKGHPHPHRALAVRMGVLAFATTLPGRLTEVYEGRHSHR